MSLSAATDKPCRVCKKGFLPFTSTQVVCSVGCARRIPVINRKAEKAELKRRKEAAKPRSKWLQEAQSEFNRYIRLRDGVQPCISCGKYHQGQWHAGHFYSVGARPELRFNEDNCHKQCQPCNTHLHGNLLKYRDELPNRIGGVRFRALGDPVDPKKYTIPDLKQIIATYRAKAKELEAQYNCVNHG